MKADIHPNYKEVEVICGCGNTFTTKSTYGGQQLRVEVCSECHPFYTGKHKILDTEGRVDQFMKRYASIQSKATAQQAAQAAPKPAKKAKTTRTKTKDA